MYPANRNATNATASTRYFVSSDIDCSKMLKDPDPREVDQRAGAGPGSQLVVYYADAPRRERSVGRFSYAAGLQHCPSRLAATRRLYTRCRSNATRSNLKLLLGVLILSCPDF